MLFAKGHYLPLNQVDGLIGIDDEVIGKFLSQIKKPVSDRVVIFEGSLFNAVFLTHDSLVGQLDWHVEDEGEVGKAVVDGDAADGENFAFGQSLASGLVGEGRGKEAIGQDALPGGQRRDDDLGHELSAGGHIKEHLASHGHFGIGRVEQQFADTFADPRGARFADFERLGAGTGDFIGQQGNLGGLSAPFGAVQDDEFAGKRRVHGQDVNVKPDKTKFPAIQFAWSGF
jgi:hypothetical protein